MSHTFIRYSPESAWNTDYQKPCLVDRECAFSSMLGFEDRALSRHDICVNFFSPARISFRHISDGSSSAPTLQVDLSKVKIDLDMLFEARDRL